MDTNQLSPLLPRLLSMTAYRNIAALPVIAALTQTLQAAGNKQGEQALQAYSQAFYQLHEAGYPSLGAYVQDHLRYDTAPYPELSALGKATPALEAAARRDLGTLNLLCSLDGDFWRQLLSAALPAAWQPMAEELPFWEEAPAPLSLEELTAFYRVNGAGLFSRHRAFVWQNGQLLPVEQPDYIPPEQLVGYRLQRNQVYENTAALLAGKRVNNVLLYGESGTGKSATVKSMLGIPAFQSLRLIEVEKTQLTGIPDLVRMLGHRPQKFVLYIDDLAFDRDDRTYSQLKTILEGGLEQSPANVAIYATSNRRHLVRETFTDRLGDEVDAAETIEEKTSLSERFGLRIPFSSLNQEQYVNLCRELAQQAGIDMPPEQLRAAAIRFNLRHPGRTPRVAQQFIHSLHP